MKIRLIVDRTDALQAIAARALPSATAENKVSFLLQERFQRQYKVVQNRKMADVITAFPAPEGVSENALPSNLAESRQIAWEKILDEELPIKKIPEHMRLTSADMPKVLKGDDGWKNGVGIAALRRMLGSLYKPTGAEVIEDKEVGDEPDEIELTPADPMAEHTEPVPA